MISFVNLVFVWLRRVVASGVIRFINRFTHGHLFGVFYVEIYINPSMEGVIGVYGFDKWRSSVYLIVRWSGGDRISANISFQFRVEVCRSW